MTLNTVRSVCHDDDMSVMPSSSPVTKMQPRFSFSVDSLLGRKTNEGDVIRTETGPGLGHTDLNSDTKTDIGDHRHRGGPSSALNDLNIKIE